jgi:hypothetical protein
MSGAASTLHNININFAAAARGQMRCHPSRGSGDLRQRRQSSRVRPLPPVALWANQRTWGGSATRGEPHRQQPPHQSPAAFPGRKHEQALLPDPDPPRT